MSIFGHLFGHRAPPSQPTFSPSAQGPFVFPGLDENFHPIRSEVRKLEPTLPDYSSYSDQQLAECFLPKNWTAASCDNTHRQAILQEASNRFADAHNLPHTSVHINSGLAKNNMGAYSPRSQCIELNPKYLNDPFEALDSVTHETQHYVDDMNVRRGSGDTPENLAVYACENSFGGYGRPPSGNAKEDPAWQQAYQYYEMQSLEAHANNAGFAAVASHHDLFKSCPEYSKYLDRRARYFGDIKDSLASDPEKWKGLEQAHIQNAAGQTPETIKTAAAEVKRGTDAQQQAVLNADGVKLLQRDCARYQQQSQQQSQQQTQQQARQPIQQPQVQPLHAAPQNDPSAAAMSTEASTSGQDTSPQKAAPPDQAAQPSAASSSARSQHDAFVESLRVKPGEVSGQMSGQGWGAAASDGAPQPPERERDPAQERDDSRMRSAAPPLEQTGPSKTTLGEEPGDARSRAVPGEEASDTQAEQQSEPASHIEESPTKDAGQVPRQDQQNEPASHTEEASARDEGQIPRQDQQNEPISHNEEAPSRDEEQAPQSAEQSPNTGEQNSAGQDQAPAAQEAEDGIREPDRGKDHGADGTAQPSDEEQEGIREPESDHDRESSEARDGIREVPEPAEQSDAGQEDGIREAPPEKASAQEESDGIRNSGEEAAPATEEAAEGISGQDSAPAESSGEEQSMGQ